MLRIEAGFRAGGLLFGDGGLWRASSSFLGIAVPDGNTYPCCRAGDLNEKNQ
jgi:hypothetical protein